MIWIEFAVSALVTAATYGAGPMLLALLRKKPLRVRYLRVFSIVYTVAVWAVWQLLTYDGGSVRTIPAMLWGYVFYRLARGILEKKPVEDARQQEQPKERWYTCPKCGQLVHEGEACDCEAKAVAVKQGVDKPKRSIVVPILSSVCVVLAVCTCFLAYRASSLEAERAQLATENTILNDTLHDLSDENAALQAQIDSKKTGSFSEWTEWRKLYEVGFISLSYDEWLNFLSEMESGTSSSFLKEKAKEEREKIDKEYGPAAYGSTCWRLWSNLSEAGYTDSSFESFASIYSARSGGLTLTQESTGKTWSSK